MLEWNDEKWLSSTVEKYPAGQIVYYSKNVDVCYSPLLIPGFPLLPRGLLAIVYALTLCYLFFGISIVADIFMSAIEKITSKRSIVNIKNENGEIVSQKKVLFWNATVANLTLMALGSSAPEILLSVIEMMKNLGSCPGELGPSTIVGSAAFNLLIISAVSVYSVDETNDTDKDKDPKMLGIKWINDMGVFSITAIFSVLSYIWLFIVLSDQKVYVWEAVLTIALFFVLIIFSFLADKYNNNKQEKL